jgi:hypothetical protein
VASARCGTGRSASPRGSGRAGAQPGVACRRAGYDEWWSGSEARALKSLPNLDGDRKALVELALIHARSALNSAAGDDEYAKLLCREGAPADALYARAAEDVLWLGKLIDPIRGGSYQDAAEQGPSG